VEVYGSHATGLCLHWSDIDLAVGVKQSENDKEPPSMNLKMQDSKIKDALRKISEGLKGEIAN
jgi:predicted nucleotidyltransferase